MVSSCDRVRVARPGVRSRRFPRSHGGALSHFAPWLGIACALLVLGVAAAAGAEATAAPQRVLLFGTPPALERALRTALTPWGMTVESSASPNEILGLAHSTERAEAVARARAATALVWLDVSSDGRTVLWLFDASTRATTGREVPAGNMDQAVAAALALSVKTTLRDVNAPEAKPEPPLVPAPTPPAGARDVLGLTAGVPHAPSWQALLSAALRRDALQPNTTEARYGLELRWAPALASGSFATPWFGARFDLGAPTQIEGSGFRGEYSELGAGLAFGLTRRLSQLFSTGVQIAFSIHSTALQGTRLPDTPLARETRWGSTLVLRPELGLSFGAIGLFAQPALGATLRGHSFAMEGQEVVFETRPVWWMIGGGVSVSLE